MKIRTEVETRAALVFVPLFLLIGSNMDKNNSLKTKLPWKDVVATLHNRGGNPA